MANRLSKAANKFAIKTGAKRLFVKKTKNITILELKKWAECAQTIEAAAKEMGHSELKQKSRALKIYIKNSEKAIAKEADADQQKVAVHLYAAQRNEYLNYLKPQLAEMHKILEAIAEAFDSPETLNFNLQTFETKINDTTKNLEITP